MNSERLANIFYKFLNKKENIVDGFIFDFYSVKGNHDIFSFEVNVILPTKDWCYLKDDMVERAKRIIAEKVVPIYGDKIVVDLSLKINGKEPLNCFINQKKLKLISNEINSKFNLFNFQKFFSTKIQYNFAPKRYIGRFEELIFIFDTVFYDLTWGNKPIKFRKEYLDEVSSWVYANVIESDLTMDIADNCFSITNDELRLLEDTLIYINLNMNSFAGMKVNNIIDVPANNREIENYFTLKNVSKSSQ